MKKIARYDQRALEELDRFETLIQKDLLGIIGKLERDGKLDYPEGKKVARNIFEIRVKRKGAFRGFYAYIEDNLVIILHFFRKKTQKTPIKHLKLAEKRLKKYVQQKN